ncbi:MAG: YgiT-type zinc finger protein [Chloroflexi bacterium]|nr:YgiT-type zinc finger protein [Chloroflexota bacterium]
MTQNEKCRYCGNEQFQMRLVRYIYSRDNHDLLVPEMPVDVCLECGMIYYHGAALLEVEAQFKAIYQQNKQPDRYLTMPVMDYAMSG